jgi:hypothetical protein
MQVRLEHCFEFGITGMEKLRVDRISEWFSSTEQLLWMYTDNARKFPKQFAQKRTNPTGALLKVCIIHAFTSKHIQSRILHWWIIDDPNDSTRCKWNTQSWILVVWLSPTGWFFEPRHLTKFEAFVDRVHAAGLQPVICNHFPSSCCDCDKTDGVTAALQKSGYPHIRLESWQHLGTSKVNAGWLGRDSKWTLIVQMARKERGGDFEESTWDPASWALARAWEPQLRHWLLTLQCSWTCQALWMKYLNVSSFLHMKKPRHGQKLGRTHQMADFDSQQ